MIIIPVAEVDIVCHSPCIVMEVKRSITKFNID